MGDKRKSNHVKAIKAWEDKKNKAKGQLYGYQAKGGSVEKRGFAQGIKGA
jgi:hypothetical protein